MVGHSMSKRRPSDLEKAATTFVNSVSVAHATALREAGEALLAQSRERWPPRDVQEFDILVVARGNDATILARHLSGSHSFYIADTGAEEKQTCYRQKQALTVADRCIYAALTCKQAIFILNSGDYELCAALLSVIAARRRRAHDGYSSPADLDKLSDEQYSDLLLYPQLGLHTPDANDRRWAQWIDVVCQAQFRLLEHTEADEEETLRGMADEVKAALSNVRSKPRASQKRSAEEHVGVPVEEEPPRKKLRVMTMVVRLKRRNGELIQGCDVYIGRQISRGGWDLPASKWANPFTVAACGTAAEAVRRYEAYVRGKPELMASVRELRGKVLGCWCKPGPCHGDVLVALADACETKDLIK